MYSTTVCEFLGPKWQTVSECLLELFVENIGFVLGAGVEKARFLKGRVVVAIIFLMFYNRPELLFELLFASRSVGVTIPSMYFHYAFRSSCYVVFFSFFELVIVFWVTRFLFTFVPSVPFVNEFNVFSWFHFPVPLVHRAFITIWMS